MVNTATRTAHELRVYYRRHIYSRGVIVYFYHLQHYALYMVNMKKTIIVTNSALGTYMLQCAEKMY